MQKAISHCDTGLHPILISLNTCHRCGLRHCLKRQHRLSLSGKEMYSAETYVNVAYSFNESDP